MNDCIFNYLNTTIYFFTLLFTILTFRIAFRIPKKIFINQSLAELIREYRTPEFGYAIDMIRDFYFKKCNSDQDKIVKMYKYVYNKEKKKQMKFDSYKKTLHYQRRIVSQFYQQLANLRYNYKDYISYDEFKKTIIVTFASNDLAIIQILYIIDKNALTQIDDENNKIHKFKINDFYNSHESLENMTKFYQEFS